VVPTAGVNSKYSSGSAWRPAEENSLLAEDWAMQVLLAPKFKKK
jgi:hypothetical protein